MTQTVSLLDGSVHPDEFSWRSAGDLPIGPRDANQPVVDPTKKPSRSVPPPKLPGAKGEYLTSEIEVPKPPVSNFRTRSPLFQEGLRGPNQPVEFDNLGSETRKSLFPQDFKDRPVNDMQGEPTSNIPIIRHGETAENEKDIAHGWSDEPLTRRGLEQSEKAADKLKSKPPTLIAYSDLKRSEQTASVIADKTGADKISIPELRTWDIGHFAGQKCGECEKELEPYVNNPDKRVPGGESFNDFRRRVFEGMQKALYAGADAIVTHNKTERLLAAAEGDGHPHENFSHKGGPGPGEMRDIKLAGDVIPGPGFGGLNWKQIYPAGARGRATLNRVLDKDPLNADFSKVELARKPGSPLTEEQKYENAVKRQQIDRLLKEGENILSLSKKSPLSKYLNPEDEPEPKL